MSNTLAIVLHTIQYNTIQYNTIQYNTIQYNTIQYNTISFYLGPSEHFAKIHSNSAYHGYLVSARDNFRHVHGMQLTNKLCTHV